MKSGTTKAKRFQVGLNAGEYYEHNQWAKTEDFKEEYKKRAEIEWKNGELKRFHGLDRADGYGLRSVRIQAKLTALAVNLKRIARIVSSVSSEKAVPVAVLANISLLMTNVLRVLRKFSNLSFQVRNFSSVAA